MTARRSTQQLPLTVRQQIWSRLWRDVLLRPRPSNSSETTGQHTPAGDGGPVGQARPSEPGRVAD